MGSASGWGTALLCSLLSQHCADVVAARDHGLLCLLFLVAGMAGCTAQGRSGPPSLLPALLCLLCVFENVDAGCQLSSPLPVYGVEPGELRPHPRTSAVCGVGPGSGQAGLPTSLRWCKHSR